MIPELRLFGGAVLVSAEGAPVKGAAAQSRRLAVLAVLAEAWPGTATRDRVIGLTSFGGGVEWFLARRFGAELGI